VETWVAAVPHVFVPCKGQSSALTKTECLSPETYDAIVRTVQEQYAAVDGGKCDNGKADFECRQADWAGCVLRMTGHDLMDYKDDFGGTDACLDMGHDDNGGLAECLVRGEHGQSLQMSYEHFCDQVSLADFLVIAAEAVMDATRKEARGGSSDMQFANRFKFGRETKTAETCRQRKHALPNPTKGCDDLKTVFEDNLGLSRRHTVALLGVHTLGRAHRDFSGFDGWWSDKQNSRSFNNNYYVSLLAKGWEPVKLDNGKIQWNRSDMKQGDKNEMMLDSDMCLAYGNSKGGNLKVNGDLEGDSACCGWLTSSTKSDSGNMETVIRNNDDFFCGEKFQGGKDTGAENKDCCQSYMPRNDCGKRPFGTNEGGWAFDTVMEFASHEVKWLREFKVAWKLATEKGHSNLQELKQCPR